MKVLTIDDMLEAARDAKLPGYAIHVQRVELAASQLAAALAQHLGIRASHASFEGKALGGTCANFSPKTEAQKCPAVIHENDLSGDWEFVTLSQVRAP